MIREPFAEAREDHVDAGGMIERREPLLPVDRIGIPSLGRSVVLKRDVVIGRHDLDAGSCRREKRRRVGGRHEGEDDVGLSQGEVIAELGDEDVVRREPSPRLAERLRHEEAPREPVREAVTKRQRFRVEIDHLDPAVDGEEGLARDGVVVEAGHFVAARRKHVGEFAIDALGAAAAVDQQPDNDGDLLAVTEPGREVAMIGVLARPGGGRRLGMVRLRAGAQRQSRSSATRWARRFADMPP